jgi:hypothetical protein
MTKLYPRTFAVMGDDQRVDSLLEQRIAALSSFIKPRRGGAGLNQLSPC